MKRKQNRNRLHSYTRWPNDLHKRIELAQADIHFANAMTKIMGRSDELFNIAAVAFRVESAAMEELAELEKSKEKGKPKPK